MLSDNQRVASDEIIDELYGLPLSEFTQARNQAASELRRAGRGAEADQVKALRKPSVAAGAVNRLVREHRREVEAFLRAAAVLRDAQFAGKGDLQAATKDEREALERLTRAGGEPVRQSLLAAAVDEQAARELLAGRLEHQLEPAASAPCSPTSDQPKQDQQPHQRPTQSRPHPHTPNQTTGPPAPSYKTPRRH